MKVSKLGTLVVIGGMGFAGSAAPALAAGMALEEVIVTAQKKAESLQDTPISLTAFGSERLETEGISSLGDIGSKVPSLTIEPFPINNATLRIFIRGIGISDAQITQDPPVGIYVDGVYIARSTGTALDVADLQRIEILRGPQGTLYGRNTTGGAINLITKKPTTEGIEFKQKFTVGNRNLFTSKSTLNVPVTDTVAVKVAAMRTMQDGHVDNSGPGGDFGDRDVTGFRFDLRWDIDDTMALDYAYDNSDFDYYNTQYQHVRPRTPIAGSQADLVGTEGKTSFGTTRQRSVGTVTSFEPSSTDIEGHAFTFTKDFDNTQIKYIFAYRELFDKSYADLGGGVPLEPGEDPHGINNESKDVFRLDSNQYCGQAAEFVLGDGECLPLVYPVVNQEQFSHELQISGDLFDSRVNYIVGAYYFEEEAQENNGPLHHQLSGPANLGIPSLSGIPGLGGALAGATTFRAVNMLSQIYDIDNSAAAVFGQFTWTPNLFEDRLHLTFGARHSEDERKTVKFQQDMTIAESSAGAMDVSFVLCGNDPSNADCRNFDSIPASQDFSNDSFSVVAEFDITDDINIYGKRVEAYKSGGFNTRDPQRDGNQGPATDGNDYGFGYADGFDAEYVTSYELGVKSELLDRRLRVNGDIFFSQYEDMQLNFILAGTVADTKVTNAGEAEMYGLEADVTFIATEQLLLMMNYAYLHTEVTKASDVNGNDVTDQFVFFSAPEHSFTLSGDYTVHQADWGRTSLNVSVNYMGERNGGSRAENVKNTHLRQYELVNARLSISDVAVGSGRLGAGFWAKNLLDEEYELTAVDNLPQADRSVIWGEPRTYGIDVFYEY
ncbi:TonB-dependent receptor [Spongiibacter sp. KMU-166]|uniref:TonB-dependent receptor n=1 Tax=Spongiibacter thalassae TaxID=2721624 RepID=A0ABX1GER7_9GAMM|nr:TonB-dependent receptor [Spongiibacter thalassae]NKI17687.1 TonB-dependent receptor [Spongiibacter thalassae]